MFRHGDVLILDPIRLPATARRRMTEVIAEGEVTGHAHRLIGGDLWDDDGDLYIAAGVDAALTHEEHAELKLPSTNDGMAYPVRIQREYDDEQEWHKVAD